MIIATKVEFIVVPCDRKVFAVSYDSIEAADEHWEKDNKLWKKMKRPTQGRYLQPILKQVITNYLK